MTLWAKRTDANHAEIRQAMRDVGAEVEDLSGCGKGMPDTLVLTPDGRLLLVEIKTATGKLTQPQIKFHARFPVHVVRSVREAVNLIHPPGPDDGTFSSRPNVPAVAPATLSAASPDDVMAG